MKFTGNTRGIQLAIFLLVVCFGLMAYCSAKAEGLSIGFGRASAGGEICMDSMLLSQTMNNWYGYLSTHGDGTCRDQLVNANIGAGIVRTADLGRWTLGFGAGVLEHGDIIVGPDAVWSSPRRTSDRIQFTASILLRYRVSKRLSVDILHNSTGGASDENRGLNTLVLSVRL